MSDDEFTPSPYEEMMLWAQQHGLRVYDAVVPGGRVTYLTSAELNPSWFDDESPSPRRGRSKGKRRR